MVARTAIVCVLMTVLGCGSDGVRHTPDGGGSGSGGGSGVPKPCAITLSSSEITGATSGSGGTCTPTLVNNTTIGVQFVVASGGDSATGNLACTISPSGVPQTLHGRSGTAGCNIVIEYNAALGATDMWADDASSTITVVVTDIPTASGTIDMTLYNSAHAPLTVGGTF